MAAARARVALATGPELAPSRAVAASEGKASVSDGLASLRARTAGSFWHTLDRRIQIRLAELV